MGSMTGAPKKRVAELIDLYEPASRGLFSGSIGYVNPAGDFDFNVVIRSLFYNKESRDISFWAGSGITHKSLAESEYEE
jgi:para-aminobenzoate synthetase component 1